MRTPGTQWLNKGKYIPCKKILVLFRRQVYVYMHSTWKLALLLPDNHKYRSKHFIHIHPIKEEQTNARPNDQTPPPPTQPDPSLLGVDIYSNRVYRVLKHLVKNLDASEVSSITRKINKHSKRVANLIVLIGENCRGVSISLWTKGVE